MLPVTPSCISKQGSLFKILKFEESHAEVNLNEVIGEKFNNFFVSIKFPSKLAHKKVTNSLRK